MLLSHARILIIGLGVSGEAAAALCASRGYVVTVTDARSRDELAPALERLAHLPISYHLGSPPPDLDGFTLLVRSPGVPDDLPVLVEAHRRRVPVWSEIELGAALCPHPIIGVTGTNGKSTTTVLIGELMRAAGRTTHVAGNIGDPFTAAVSGIPTDDAAVVVVEVSAAQLEDCHAFKPHIAVLTNVHPEHMDRYTWDEYISAKSRIVRNHTSADVTVANWDDALCRQIAGSTPGRTLFFSPRPLPAEKEGVFCEDGQVVTRFKGARIVVCQQREVRVPGALPNVMAMMTVGLADGIPVEVIREVATSYAGREHVLEYVTSAAGVDYYNDSKATNPWSTLHALDALSGRPIVLITGGKDDKDADVVPLAAALGGQVRHLITMGQTGPRTAAAARAHGMAAVTEAAGLPHAVARAIEVARPGDVVLFSPGANSKDMFPDHRTRGDLFKQQVRRLRTSAARLRPVGR